MSPKPAVRCKCLILTITTSLLAMAYVYLSLMPSVSVPLSSILLPQSFRAVDLRPNSVNGTFSNTHQGASVYQRMYDDIKCIMERSNNTCSFPLLTDYHRRCGRFPASTSWKNIAAGYPQAVMSADICKLAPVTSAAQRLRQYIEERNISSIVTFGDSQGLRYSNALLAIVKQASYACELAKVEPPGYSVYLNYFTKGSGFTTTAIIPRTCHGCNSHLHVCSDKWGHRLEIEYLSMITTERTGLHLNNSECHRNGTKHPLCSATTLPQFVFQHYLSRHRNYPQLLLLFSGFAHDRDRPLEQVYNEVEWLYSVLTAHVPASSSLIWYDAPSWHAKEAAKRQKWSTSEGNGYNPNEKMRAENQFLSVLQSQHHRSGKSPPMFSFFDLYQMQEQLLDAWGVDHVHSKPSWYQYVMGYTANMLPSLPVSNVSRV